MKACYVTEILISHDDFFFFWQVKIAVKFVDGWPVIGRIRFCFAHPPYIQMTASPLYKGGIDVTYFPGADRWLVIYNICLHKLLNFF
jgi:Ca2+-dependent lipid-binding protein